MVEKNLSFPEALRLALALGLVAIVLFLAFILSDILVTFLVAIIFAIALDKPIDKLVKKKVPRQAAALSIYFIFLIVIGFISFSLLPPLAKELSNFTVSLPIYLEGFLNLGANDSLARVESLNMAQYLQAFSEIIGSSSKTIFGQISLVFGGVASFLVIFFVALFLNIQKNGVRNLFLLLVPKKHLEYADSFFNKMQDSLNGWLWGKLMSSVIIAIVIYLGLLLIGIPYAIVFAVMALILNFIPFLGPVIAVIIPAFIGFTISPWSGIFVFALYFIANGIIESFILLPIFMKRAINMNPILLILFVLIGGRLAGVMGVVISIPVAAVMSLIINEFLSKKGVFSLEEKED